MSKQTKQRLVCSTNTANGSKFCRIVSMGDSALDDLAFELDEERSSHREAQTLVAQCQIQLETHKAELARLRRDLGKANSLPVAEQQIAIDEARQQLKGSEKQVARAEGRIAQLEAEVRRMADQCRAQESNKANEMALQDVINDLRVLLAQKEGGDIWSLPADLQHKMQQAGLVADAPKTNVFRFTSFDAVGRLNELFSQEKTQLDAQIAQLQSESPNNPDVALRLAQLQSKLDELAKKARCFQSKGTPPADTSLLQDIQSRSKEFEGLGKLFADGLTAFRQRHDPLEGYLRDRIMTLERDLKDCDRRVRDREIEINTLKSQYDRNQTLLQRDATVQQECTAVIAPLQSEIETLRAKLQEAKTQGGGPIIGTAARLNILRSYDPSVGGAQAEEKVRVLEGQLTAKEAQIRITEASKRIWRQ